MIGATIFAVVFFVFLIAICIGFIILQIRLSKMDSKWPGLVLPAIAEWIIHLCKFCFSSFVYLCFYIFLSGDPEEHDSCESCS